MEQQNISQIESIAQEITKINEAIAIEYVQQERDAAKFNLNNQQHVIMTILSEHPDMKPSELAQRLGVSKSAISQQLQKLKTRDYIYLYKDENDKRVSLIGLGKNGLAYQQSIDDYVQAFTRNCAEQFSYEELIEIRDALTKLQKII
ncbi:MarR family transcriptional regulator [Staphylococcus sp. EZ-P03]|uniref:MarR family winged helix-turn-helix transcriptional regulator n=1 Tax=Staphylococcus sp. EZ-P03 TaxID=2282739 RepID=UPI000DF7DBC8|nr:MarR family transcriptional regulator [Staphylococcus sp. EZ-P03]